MRARFDLFIDTLWRAAPPVVTRPG